MSQLWTANELPVIDIFEASYKEKRMEICCCLNFSLKFFFYYYYYFFNTSNCLTDTPLPNAKSLF